MFATLTCVHLEKTIETMAITLPQVNHFGDFPPPHQALDEPNGLLAYGGNLSVGTLINAYKNGIFPWYSPGEPLLWWSPDPRSVLFPEAFHLSKSFRKFLRRTPMTVTLNHKFDQVIAACANVPRYDKHSLDLQEHDAIEDESNALTWISAEMQQAYRAFADVGFAHSIEVWQNNTLVGGLYGVNVGQIFCGESMFHTETNASKLAMYCLTQLLKPFKHSFIDCQIQTEHLASLGAQMVPRSVFLKDLAKARNKPLTIDFWAPRTLFEEQQWLG